MIFKIVLWYLRKKLVDLNTQYNIKKIIRIFQDVMTEKYYEDNLPTRSYLLTYLFASVIKEKINDKEWETIISRGMINEIIETFKNDNYSFNNPSSNEKQNINYTEDELKLKIQTMAEKISPDYPNISKCNSWEQLYAIESTYDGTEEANKSCHDFITYLLKKLKISDDEGYKHWEKLDNYLSSK